MVADLMILRGHFHHTARPELVEGSYLLFLLAKTKNQGQPFDKLRASGLGGWSLAGYPAP
jgi:hypothetical protein